MTISTVRCPFCFSEKEAEAPVCPTCNRDTEIPASLRKELEDLVKMRDRLRDELIEKEARLSARLPWIKALSDAGGTCNGWANQIGLPRAADRMHRSAVRTRSDGVSVLRRDHQGRSRRRIAGAISALSGPSFSKSRTWSPNWIACSGGSTASIRGSRCTDLQRPGDPKAYAGSAHIMRNGKAPRGPQVGRAAVPRTAAPNMVLARPERPPVCLAARGAIWGNSVHGLMIAVLDQLVGIPVHVVESELVGRDRKSVV